MRLHRAFSAPWVYTLHIITRWMWCGEGAIKPTPTPGLMAWWGRIHDNATSIQIHNYNVNNHGAIWSILGTGSPGYSAFIARLDCCCVNGNCAFNMQSRHSCVNNNGAFMAQCNILRYMKTPCKFVAMWKGYLRKRLLITDCPLLRAAPEHVRLSLYLFFNRATELIT